MPTDVSYTQEMCTVVESTDSSFEEVVIYNSKLFGYKASRSPNGGYDVYVMGASGGISFFLPTEAQYQEFRNWCAKQ